MQYFLDSAFSPGRSPFGIARKSENAFKRNEPGRKDVGSVRAMRDGYGVDSKW